MSVLGRIPLPALTERARRAVESAVEISARELADSIEEQRTGTPTRARGDVEVDGPHRTGTGAEATVSVAPFLGTFDGGGTGGDARLVEGPLLQHARRHTDLVRDAARKWF